MQKKRDISFPWNTDCIVFDEECGATGIVRVSLGGERPERGTGCAGLAQVREILRPGTILNGISFLGVLPHW